MMMMMMKAYRPTQNKIHGSKLYTVPFNEHKLS